MTKRIAGYLVQNRSAWLRYSIATILAVVALLLNDFLSPFTEANLLFLSTVAMVGASVLGGFGSGLAALFISAFGFNLMFLGTPWSWRIESSEDLLKLCIFLVSGLLAGFLGSVLRKALLEERRAICTSEVALSSRDEFIAMAAHEMKSPMTAARLQVQLFQRKVQRGAIFSQAELDAFSSRALLSLSRLHTLVDELMDASKATHGKLELNPAPNELGSVVQNVVARYEQVFQEMRVELRVSRASEMPVSCDAARIEQVISNLLSNALKYGAGPVEVITKKDGGFYQLAVRDHGPGVPAGESMKLFEKFERANRDGAPGGLGLGLYIANSIMALHGGTLWAENAEGGGARFCLKIPVGEPGAKAGSYLAG